MDDINCHALILNSEIAMRFRMIGERQVLKGDIPDLSLYMCEFNPSRRQLTKHHVLHPCSVSLNGSTPEGKGLHLSLEVTEIKLSISPSIIELLNKAMITFTTQEKGDSDIVKPPPDYSEIWDAQDYRDKEFWFLNKTEDEGIDALSMNLVIGENKEELCMAEIPSIILIIETGSGYQTIPLLYIETSMQAQIKNWSWQMSVESYLRLAMSYYNSSLALWEPIIEPNERENSAGLLEYGPWELSLSVAVEKDENEDEEPTTKMCVSSKDILELSVTKTCLDVLQSLGNAFSEAIKPSGLVKPTVESPFVVQNDTGFEITINMVEGAFLLHNSHLPNSGYILDELTSKSVIFVTNKTESDLQPSDVRVVKISAGGKAYLQLKSENQSSAVKTINILSGKVADEKCLHIKIGDIDKEIILPVHKADKRYFPLYRDTKKEPWGIVSDIVVEYGCTVITVHGILQIENHFSTPITLHRLKDDNKSLVIGEILPGTIYNLPLHAIYSNQKEIYFSLSGYKMSVQGISWKENPSDFKLIRTIQCDPITTFEPFYINVSNHIIIYDIVII